MNEGGKVGMLMNQDKGELRVQDGFIMNDYEWEWMRMNERECE